ncbi:cytochrome c family protein [Janthinobacterium sp. BJB446]|uniref:c-type cytochrome n=1 Tax=Janthinobacterium sp. BJB446 TaxID=2048009 RepID=UPI000C0FA202|nr:cytochrome c family protein [Janthinobacterium sp. BJB446]PHV22941.1 cytochrome c family protein [Janthinobacterium sp. BJB446]
MTYPFLFRWFSPLAAAAVLLAPVAVAQAAAPAALTGNAEAGKAAFRKCASCHQVGPSARGGFGPKLTGVIGRKAGSTTDYKYSAAMKNTNIVWTEQNLAGFLKAPSDFIPGNNMRFWGIGNAQQVADLLAYLRTQ